MKKRYYITSTKHMNFVSVTDLKHNRTFWIHITDFGITHQHLPAYCRTEAEAIIATQRKAKS